MNSIRLIYSFIILFSSCLSFSSNLIILHGSPASGKLSIARELSLNSDNTVVLHNHLITDITYAILKDFNDPRFLAFNHNIKIGIINEILKINKDIIMTICFCSKYDAKNINEIIQLVEESGGSVTPVFINTNRTELLERCAKDSRIGTTKIHTTSSLKDILSKYDFDLIQHGNTIVIENSDITEKEAAIVISDRLKEHI